jgi:hypothetical protein
MQRHRLVRIWALCVLAVSVFGAGTLGFATPTHAAQALSVSRGSAAPGDAVTVNGTGFHAGDDIIVAGDVTVGGKARHIQTAATADANGSFTSSLTIPKGTNQDKYMVYAKDFHGGYAQHALEVLPVAYAAAGATHTGYVIPFHQFYVDGHGFQANESVTVTASFPQYDGNTTVVQRKVQADKNGNFTELLLQTPGGAKAGVIKLTAKGDSSGKIGMVNLHVFFRPSITLAATTVRPGATVTVKGVGFVPNTSVRVSVSLTQSNGTTQTLTRSVTSNGSGNFTGYLPLPAGVSPGKQTVSAVDTVGGYHSSTPVTVAINPSINLAPNSAYPGQNFVVSGANFGNGATIHITASFPASNGSHTALGRYVRASGNGFYTATLNVPGGASAGKVIITAASSSGHVSAPLFVKQRPTPMPTATATTPATAAPAPTATTAPASPSSTSTPGSHHHKPGFDFRYISIWYHTLRVNTTEHIVVQSTLHTQQGIWVHVWFPSGSHFDYFKNTDSNGKWTTQFVVPRSAITPHNGNVLVTFRLWHGKKSVKQFLHFKLVY